MLSFDAFFKKIFLDTCHNWIIFHVAMQICICWKLQIDSEILTDFLFCHWICRNRIQMINFHNLLVFLVKIKAALQFTLYTCDLFCSSKLESQKLHSCIIVKLLRSSCWVPIVKNCILFTLNTTHRYELNPIQPELESSAAVSTNKSGHKNSS